MKNSEKETIQESLSSVNPYLTNPSDLEKRIEKISEKSSNVEEFKKNFEKEIPKQEDPSVKADYRIFLNKLKSKKF